MALDNSSYDALQDTYFKIKDHLESAQLIREHSALMLKHEELGTLLEDFDVEALEEQTKDIHGLHDQLDAVTAVAKQINEYLKDTSDTVAMINGVVTDLDAIFTKIQTIQL